jgi:hypothetical protein
MAGFREYQDFAVGFNGRDQIFVLPRYVNDLDFLQIDLGILGIIPEPCKNTAVVEKMFHNPVTPFDRMPFCLASLLYRIAHGWDFGRKKYAGPERTQSPTLTAVS